MKRKIILSAFVLITLLILSGCSLKKENNIATNDNSNNMANEVSTSSNSLVLYFSATGTTKAIAEQIASASNGDIIEIIPKVKYTSDDLNYNSDCRANKEQNDPSARPEIEGSIDVSKYDTIYLGYPIWWGKSPKIIFTLLDSYDFTGKVIIPFCTSGSSGISESVNELRSYNSKLNIKDGKRFSSSDSDEDIIYFINNNK